MPGMLAALKTGSEGIKVTDEELSWIASIINITCFAGYIIGNIVVEKFGRKWSVSIMTVPVLITWTTVYFAQDFMMLFISRVAAGISYAGVLLIIIVCTAEYISPEIRGYGVCLMNAVAPAVGAASGHILGLLLHWRTVALIGIVPCVLTVLISFFWLESPSWLAAQGKFKECEKVFRILRGDGEKSEKELRLLIELERFKLNKLKQKKAECIPFVIFHKAIKQLYFWKILALGTAIALVRTASGKVLFNTFAVTILQDVTKNNDVLLFTVLIDTFIVLGTVISCILLNKMKMRKLILPTLLLSVFLLVCLSAGIYFKQDSNIYVAWANSVLMALYFISVYVSSSALENYHSEICPLEIKPMFFSLLAVINSVFIFSSIKLAASMIRAMGYYGLFLLDAFILLMCVVYLYKYLPETRGRTLQEIELFFKTNSFDKADDLLKEDPLKELV